MTRMTGLDCAVMCNCAKHTHTYSHTPAHTNRGLYTRIVPRGSLDLSAGKKRTRSGAGSESVVETETGTGLGARTGA